VPLGCKDRCPNTVERPRRPTGRNSPRGRRLRQLHRVRRRDRHGTSASAAVPPGRTPHRAPRRHVRSDGAGEVATEGLASWVPHFVDRMEARLEALAPGFTSLIRARHVFTPAMLEREDPNLFGGAINGGTSQIHQQLIFRPIPGWGRSETPISALYLASASAHPGGGVHGAPGANAAQAALLPFADGRSRPFGRGLTRPLSGHAAMSAGRR
jgi:phytoene dehydrogenase-like protein